MKAKGIVLLIVLSLNMVAEPARISTTEYINTYKDVAIQEMKDYDIPASITLAQGILESASGNSYLAKEANNHFGIKCHRDWKGKKVYQDDDEENECFRAYKDAKDSYRDHSLFLKNRSRYAFLFEEDITDYKAWAKGLKKAGYATNKKYPQLLIKLIEDYKLYQYDEEKDNALPLISLSSTSIQKSDNNVKFIIATEEDTWENIAIQTERKVSEILKYNELNYDAKLKEGQLIYIQPKRRKAAREFKTHKVKEGETMYSISQKYAIKLKYLYKKNAFDVGDQPKVGDILKLR